LAKRWAIGKSIEILATQRGTKPGDLFADLQVADDLGSKCLVAVGTENAQLVT
jgi:N-acyl-D-amino-acid deacylase